MKKSLQVKQRNIAGCGVACLASIAAYYELKLPVARIRQYASANKKAPNIMEMIEAAQKLGFEAKGVKGSPECLTEIPKPAIAHVIVEEQMQHFVVIYKATEQAITVMDPDDGKLHKKTHEEFRKSWTGALILLFPAEISARIF